ncbi:MAG: hypothetical protein KatS3mg051_1749 [Anaerolineae bacterium]|nr:MAG: hypothetical protein KatS3mg051_1749 [Anaerolineae bacterium]
MLAVLLLAAYLRLHDLNAQGMWGDEGWSIWLARGDTLRDLTMTMVFDHHGPVYSALLRGWELLAGQTVLALRWITALFSLASIALIYALGRELFNPAAGVGAALAFALMDKHVVLTQEVRDYPMVFFTMIAIALFYARWRRAPRGGNAFWFVAASVFGLYLHYYCYMVNLAILLHAALTLRGRERWRHFLALNALIALAFAPWLPVVVHQFINTPVDSEVLTIHGMPLNRHTVDYLASESFGKPIALYGLLLVAGAWAPLSHRLPGVLGRIPRDRRLGGALLALLWFALPCPDHCVAAQPLSPADRPQHLGDHARHRPAGGRGADRPSSRSGGSFLAALIVVNGLLTTSSYFDKPPWREMAADVSARYPRRRTRTAGCGRRARRGVVSLLAGTAGGRGSHPQPAARRGRRHRPGYIALRPAQALRRRFHPRACSASWPRRTGYGWPIGATKPRSTTSSTRWRWPVSCARRRCPMSIMATPSTPTATTAWTPLVRRWSPSGRTRPLRCAAPSGRKQRAPVNGCTPCCGGAPPCRRPPTTRSRSSCSMAQAYCAPSTMVSPRTARALPAPGPPTS